MPDQVFFCHIVFKCLSQTKFSGFLITHTIVHCTTVQLNAYPLVFWIVLEEIGNRKEKTKQYKKSKVRNKLNENKLNKMK